MLKMFSIKYFVQSNVINKDYFNMVIICYLLYAKKVAL